MYLTFNYAAAAKLAIGLELKALETISSHSNYTKQKHVTENVVTEGTVTL